MIIGTMLCKTIVVLTLSFLKEIYAAQCTEPSLSMCKCTRTIIDCANQNLTQIPSNIPAATTQLSFENNHIKSIDATSLSGLTSLLIIDLSSNEISSIEAGVFSLLPSLTGLYLRNNKINSIDASLLSGLASLYELDLSYNEISSIEAGVLSLLPSLLSLFLRNNKITSIDASSLSGITSLLRLGLSFNPLVCCSMKGFVDWANNRSWNEFYGSCTDFKTSTPILRFNTSECIVPVDGGWNAWNNSTCSMTCGVGIVSSNRTCDNPLPSHGGKNCSGEASITKSCNLVECPVDGGWSAWYNSTCSVTCGIGIISSTRTCDSPLPSHDGKQCIGEASITISCKLVECPESCSHSSKRSHSILGKQLDNK